ncbi:MAG TPA: ATP-dependent DNA helicase RecG [Chloroflexia bacterium]|nr:ATP-dependent DNA helicase RecG [Chloroflexia bacterium]
MAADIEKLEKILRLEIADNYRDQKVFRGLAAFISNWTRTAINSNPTPAEARLVEKVAHDLIEYGSMTILQRAKAIQAVLDETARLRNSRNGNSASSAHSNGLSPKPQVEKSVPVATAPARILKTSVVEPEIAPVPPHSQPAAKSKAVSVADLHAPLTTVKGVGETYAKLLSFINLHTIHDALYYFPFRHEDFSSFKKINELMYGQTESIVVQVIDTVSVRTKGGKEMIEVIVADETGRLSCIFYNRRMVYALKQGAQVVMSGRVDQWNGRICFKSPSYEAADRETLNTGRLVPVYSTTGPLKVQTLRKLIKACVDTYSPALPEHLPADIRARHALLDLPSAVRGYHFPADQNSKELARRRLAFDEFFLIQLGVLLKRHEWQEERPGEPIQVERDLLQQWYDSLVFKVSRLNEETGKPQDEFRKLELTRAQQRAIEDIIGDIQKPKPMNRLLQGDVGSGKTVVGATALLMAVANGFQGALMAPTQILAEQHFQGLRRLFDLFEQSEVAQERGLKVRMELLTGNVKKKDAAYRRIRDGEVDIVVGTSAVIQEVVSFHRLGLVIIDEQHRFGVLQRKTLRGKGATSTANPDGTNPHLLVMTATPIPRTLNLTVYGDLDLSIMNEMPPGRQPIKTKWVMPNERQGAYNFIRKQINLGHQAFVICPLVEESEKIEAKAAVEEYERLQREVFPDLKLGLLHGKMKPTEKDMIMHQFRDREFDILVATSVIEVGIDIPNATVILIEGADRFGLAQLHQFRGRVGRGQGKSYCLLLASDELSQVGRERLKAIEDTNDGFVLAEIDLRMRGPGEFFGTRQSGVPDLRVAGVNDIELLETARKEATRLFERDAELKQTEHKLLAQKVAALWSFEGDLS